MKLYYLIVLSILISCGADKLATKSGKENSSLVGKITKTGIDIQGRTKTCTEMSPETICTMSFEPGDQYAEQCKSMGGSAFACGCHDYICIR